MDISLKKTYQIEQRSSKQRFVEWICLALTLSEEIRYEIYSYQLILLDKQNQRKNYIVTIRISKQLLKTYKILAEIPVEWVQQYRDAIILFKAG